MLSYATCTWTKCLHFWMTRHRSAGSCHQEERARQAAPPRLLKGDRRRLDSVP